MIAGVGIFANFGIEECVTAKDIQAREEAAGQPNLETL